MVSVYSISEIRDISLQFGLEGVDRYGISTFFIGRYSLGLFWCLVNVL